MEVKALVGSTCDVVFTQRIPQGYYVTKGYSWSVDGKTKDVLERDKNVSQITTNDPFFFSSPTHFELHQSNKNKLHIVDITGEPVEIDRSLFVWYYAKHSSTHVEKRIVQSRPGIYSVHDLSGKTEIVLLKNIYLPVRTELSESGLLYTIFISAEQLQIEHFDNLYGDNVEILGVLDKNIKWINNTYDNKLESLVQDTIEKRSIFKESKLKHVATLVCNDKKMFTVYPQLISIAYSIDKSPLMFDTLYLNYDIEVVETFFSILYGNKLHTLRWYMERKQFENDLLTQFAALADYLGIEFYLTYFLSIVSNQQYEKLMQ